ncbi:MAG: class I adenylate-forming enzyme family protein [FCB group bacterium]|jgi:acyl-CoA synthetase (AMP-forming)/AMP-acid ligase II|nr:class I adenylate-forming enzyme family protein [FCB group bacterium]
MPSASPQLSWQYVEKWAETRPLDESLVFKGRRLNWSEVRARVDATAKAFIAAGVGKGDRVALLSMGCLEFPITFMAAAKIGAVWLGLSPKFTRPELAAILTDARPNVLIGLREFNGNDLSSLLLDLRGDVPEIREVWVIGDPFDGAESFEACTARPRPRLDETLGRMAAEVGPGDDLLLMYTSGSTGTPKGVIHTHRSTMTSVEIQNRHFGTREKSRLFMQFPINHVAADVELGLAAIRAGATLVIEDRFDPAESLRIVERERITFLGGVPAMFLLQFATPEFKEVDLSSVETFVWGGSPAPRAVVETLAKIASRTGARLVTGYGSTETGGFVTYSNPEDDLQTLTRTAGCAARPVELRIVDEHRQRLSLGEPGEIAFRGPSLMRGYWNNATATREVMDDEGWYYSGDVAWLDERGCLHMVGRTSEMYKTGGENVYPREVEEVLERHPAVASAAVIGVANTTYHEVGVAFLVLRSGASATDEELRAHCRSILANFKVPKYFECREKLPVLASGKVDKLALKRDVLPRFQVEY